MTDHSATEDAEPILYSWAVRDAKSSRGACGVTSQPARAVHRLQEELAELPPGAAGMIQEVRLDRSVGARHPSYVHGKVLACVGARPSAPAAGDPGC
ncbi:hypothetical protein [Nonomuraea sp. NPDC023979]|uniref:hypothetical protein n=1 Tax=Nonomuraea sp. NPDC023979 TaxID=3154796 RepID=UPI0033EF4614